MLFVGTYIYTYSGDAPMDAGWVTSHVWHITTNQHKSMAWRYQLIFDWAKWHFELWSVCVNTYCMLPSWIVELRQKKKTPKRTWTFLIGAHIEGHRSTCSSLSSLASTVTEPLKQILVSQSQSYPLIKQNEPIRSSRLALKQFLKAVLWERNRKVYKQQKSAMICAGLENKATMK